MLQSLEVITTGNFSAQLIEDVLWVAFIPRDEVKLCAWPLIRAMLYRHEGPEASAAPADRAPGESADDGDGDAGFLNMTHDDDGLSVVMDDVCKRSFDDFRGAGSIEYAPSRWRAFQIHLGTSAMHGVVCLLSSMLGEANISILNLSTYDGDFILVQERDTSRAAALIRDRLQRGLRGLNETLEAMALEGAADGAGAPGPDGDAAERALSDKSTARRDTDDSDGLGGPGTGAGPDDEGKGAGQLADGPPPAQTGQSAIQANAQNLYLKVLAPTLMLARLNPASLPEVSHLLLRLLLFPPPAADGRPAQNFWSYSHVLDGAGEISLIVDHRAAALFPEGAIVGECGPWRCVKLCGHRFAFDETGVVSGMLHAVCARGIPVLNLSTFSHNLTIVEDHWLPGALDAFRVVSSRVEWEDAAEQA